MDVDPEQSEAEIVQELERTQKDPGEFFESVPVVVFADKGKRARLRRDREDDATDEQGIGEDRRADKPMPIWLWLIPAAILLMCLGGGVTALAFIC